MGEWSENVGFIGRLFVLGFFFRLHGSHDCLTQSGTTHGMYAEFDFPMGKLGLAFAIVGFSDGENVGPHSFEIVEQLIIKGYRVGLISEMIHVRGRKFCR